MSKESKSFVKNCESEFKQFVKEYDLNSTDRLITNLTRDL